MTITVPAGKQPTRPPRVFCSYAHEDAQFVGQLKSHLAPLLGSSLEEFWCDTDITAGTRWEHAIHEKLKDADIIIFLVSHHFHESEYCSHIEFETALSRQGEAWLVPILVRNFYYEATPFAELEMLLKENGELVALEGLTKVHKRNQAYTKIVRKVHEYVRTHQFVDRRLADDHREDPVPVELPCHPDIGPGRLWNLPRLALKVFASDEFLDRLHDNLTADDELPVVVTGQGGLGKTTIVHEYARRHSSDYDHVFWLAAQDETILSQQCTKLAQHLGLPAADQYEARSAIRKWLSDHPSWLIILDNVIDQLSYETFESFLPKNARGQVLMTSRAGAVWHGLATEMRLPRRPLKDCVDMLLAWSGEEDRAAAEELCVLINRLPLEIWRAAQEMRKSELTIDQYIARLRSKLAPR